MEHARLGPSSAYRWTRCPASIGLSEQVPPRASGPAAAAGGLMHAVFERRLLGQSDFHSDELAELAELDVSPARARQIVSQALVAAHGALAQYGVTEYLTERRVNPGGVVQRDDFWGTADLIGANQASRTLLVGDLKTGRGRVEVKHNEQLLCYALGALELIDFEPERIVLAIFQPPVFGERAALWQTDARTLQEFGVFVGQQAALTDQADLPPSPSTEACQWCPAKPVCPAHRRP